MGSAVPRARLSQRSGDSLVPNPVAQRIFRGQGAGTATFAEGAIGQTGSRDRRSYRAMLLEMEAHDGQRYQCILAPSQGFPADEARGGLAKSV